MGRPAWRRRRLLPPQHPSKWATPGLSIQVEWATPSQLPLLTPYPPVDPAHQSSPAWTAGPPASSCPPSAVNPVHAVAPPAELPSLLPRSLPPPNPSSSTTSSPPSPAAAHLLVSARAAPLHAWVAAPSPASYPAGPRISGEPLAPQARARSRFSCHPELQVYWF
ncbi:hypothetical protein VPH35_115526 [Triticum aestivum]